MGNRLIAWVLTSVGINFCAWGQTAGTFQNAGLTGSGTITAIAAIPGLAGAKLIGTRQGRIYRLTDGAAPWHMAMADAGAPVTAFLGLEDGSWLAGAGVILDGIVVDCFTGPCVIPEGGIFRSEDKGISWSRVRTKGATAFAVRAGRVYAADLMGIASSSDQGRTWSQVPMPITRPHQGTSVRSLAWIGDKLCMMSRYSGSDVAVLRGDSLHLGVTPFFDRGESIFHSAPWLYALAYSEDTETLKRSGDGGQTWEVLSRGNFNVLAAGPGGLYAITDNAISVSADGRAWNRVAPGFGSARNVDAFLAEGELLYLGGTSPLGLGVYRKGDSAWSVSNRRLYDGATQAVGFHNDRLYADGGPNGTLSRNDAAEANWIRTAIPESRQLISWKGRLYANSFDGIWSLSDPADPASLRNLGQAQGISPARDWLALYSFAYQGSIFKVCRDAVPVACDSAAMIGFPAPVYDLFGMRVDKFWGMAVSGDTVLIALDSIWFSSDRGAHWEIIGPLPGKASFLAADAGEFWLGGADGLFRFDAVTRTWAASFESGLGKPNAIVFRSDGRALMATDRGVYTKGRWESKWTDFSQGLEDRNVRSLTVDGDRLAVGLTNGGVWIRELEPVSGIRTQAKGFSGLKAFKGNNAGYGLFRDAEGGLFRPDGKVRKSKKLPLNRDRGP